MNFPKYTNLTYISGLSGSTGANLYKNTTDKKWVIKRSKKGEGGYEQVKIEAVANDIYQALGIPVPRHFIDEENKALVLEYIDGKLLKDASPEEEKRAKDDLKKGFIVDALLANWDVIGLNKDNIIIPNDGSPAVRIDNGGSLIFRAQGKKKPFGKKVTEIETMIDKKISPQAAKIFGDLTNSEIREQIRTIILPNYDLILSLTPDEIKDTMRARLDSLIKIEIMTKSSSSYNNIYNTIINYSKYNSSSTYKTLTLFDKKVIKYYTSSGSNEINTFLYSNDYVKINTDKNIYKLIINKYPIKNDENIYDYNKRLLYYFFVNLYNAISKGIRLLNTPIKVYRGTKTWYLNESTDKFYYSNSFTSTTIDYSISAGFSKPKPEPEKNINTLNTYISKIYIFLIHPLCNYIYLKNLSKFKHENEILLAPYYRYLYVGEILEDTIVQKKFIIIPTDLDIPSSFESFINWKDNIVNISKNLNEINTLKDMNYNNTINYNIKNKINNITIKNNTRNNRNRRDRRDRHNEYDSKIDKLNYIGGKISVDNSIVIKTEPNNNHNIYTIKNLKLKSNRLNISKNRMNITRKINKTNIDNINNSKEIYTRFEEPIHSFPGKSPTYKEKEIINQMIKFF